MDTKRASNWYRWLWFSPLLTIPTLVLVYVISYEEIPAVLVSAAWHLILLIPATNKRDRFISWHGRQAMALAGLRTLVVFIFHELIIEEFIGFVVVTFLLVLIWFFGTRWGQKEAKAGKCSFRRWFSDQPIRKKTPDQATPKEPHENKDFLRLNQLEFLLEETKDWEIPESVRAPYEEELQKLRIRLFPPRQAKVTRDPQKTAWELDSKQAVYALTQKWLWSGSFPNNILDALRKCGAYLQPQIDALSKEIVGKKVERKKLTEIETLDFALNSLKEWGDLDTPLLRDFLLEERMKRTRPKPAPTQKVVDAVPKPVSPKTAHAAPAAVPAKAAVTTTAAPTMRRERPAPKPKPQKPPKPKRPPIQWGKFWEKTVEMAVSGALLRGLLYLGAFMIVVSAAILVVRFWDVFPEALQLVFIFSVPTAFYLIGWLVRGRLKLPQAGGVLTGIGALLVAVDFAAVYQFGGLEQRLNGNAYWLGASILCMLIYGITAWRIPGDFFDYITLIGFGSAILALTRFLILPYEWSAVAMSAVGTAIFAFSLRKESKSPLWQGLARAARYLPHIIIPASLFAVIFIPNASHWAQTSTFALTAIGYGLLAWKAPATIFAHATAWSLIGAVGFALLAVDLPIKWYATAASLLAIFFILSGYFMGKQINEEKKYRQGYLVATHIAGFGLLGLAVISGLTLLSSQLWAAVTALALSSLVLAGSALLFQRPFFVFFAAGLFNVPFLAAAQRLLADGQVEQETLWLMATWGGLALLYLSLSVLLRKAEKYARHLVLWTHLIAPAVGFMLLLNYNSKLSSISTLAALGILVLIYLFSAFLNDGDWHPAISESTKKIFAFSGGKAIYLWVTGFLVPIWAAVAWTGSIYPQAWMGVVFAGLALAYVGLGIVLLRRDPSYRLPFHFYAYLLCLTGIIIGIDTPWALLTTLYLSVVSLAVLAWHHKRIVETTFASLLLLWAFQISLQLSPFTEHGYTLAYLLLAGIIYIPLGILLRQKGDKQTKVHHEVPIYVVGYAVSAGAVIASALGRFDVYPYDLPWVGALVPFLAAVLYIFSVYYFRKEKPLTQTFSALATITFTLAFGQALTLFKVLPEYDATAWLGLALAYLLLERVIASKAAIKWFAALRLSLGIGAFALALVGWALTLDATFQTFFYYRYPPLFPRILAQTLAVIFVVLAARFYRKPGLLYLEPPLSFFPVTLFFIGYGEYLFGQQLTTLQYSYVWSALGIIHLIAAVLLDKNKTRYAHGIYLGSYGSAIFAISWTLLDPVSLSWTLGLGILMAIASALLVHHRRHHTWDDLLRALFKEQENALQKITRAAFLWITAWTFPVWLTIALGTIKDMAPEFRWLGLGVSGLLYIGVILWLHKVDRSYTWPFHTAGQFYVAVGIIISLPLTLDTFAGPIPPTRPHESGLAFILLQWMTVLYYALSAWMLRERKRYYTFSFIAAFLAFLPYTLGWQFYQNDLFGRPITQAEFGVVWMLLAFVMLVLAVILDQPARRPGLIEAVEQRKKYAHGPYLASYLITFFAILWTYTLWTLESETALFWTLGLGILLFIASAVLVHFNLHHAWDDMLRAIFGVIQNTFREVLRGTFIWLVAALLPLWSVLLLRQLELPQAFTWLGFVGSALLLLGLAIWLRKLERTYAWSLYLSSQIYTLVALILSIDFFRALWRGFSVLKYHAGTGLAIIMLQGLAVLFYTISAWAYKNRKAYYPFPYIAATLTFFPYTLGWQLYRPLDISAQYTWAWMGLAVILLAAGFLLDRKQISRHVRYAHGPYFVGYALIAYAIAVSAPERLANIYTLIAAILVAILSQVLVHSGLHHAFDDFVRFWWRKPETNARRAAQMLFLFFASYTFPVWLAQLLTYHETPLAWRGFSLALLAPLYIALGLVLKRFKGEYTWAMYSAGYALTAIGAMVAFDDIQLTIAVLSLNAVVYAVSTYIFRQSFWLYLSNLLLPVIVLLSLYYANSLHDPWVAKSFMGLAFLYVFGGVIVERRSKKSGDVSPYSMPFYAPGYLLSAIALAVASGERSLATLIYLAGTLLYGISAWWLRESIFLYPAVWLLTVPYYLGMTLIPELEPRWYGLGWMPLIVVYILLGRFIFHKQKIAPPIFAHTAMPFYLLAYPLTVSVIALSAHARDPLVLTYAFATSAVIYLASAGLFKRSAWFYPGLFAAHMGLLSYFSINSSGGGSFYKLSLPFHLMAWLMLLIGYAFSRLFPVAHRTGEGKLLFKLWRWELDFGKFPFVGHLITPSWAQPFFIFAALDIVLWQSVAFANLNMTIIVAMGNALLLGLFALLWLDSALVYGSLAFLLTAIAYRLHWAEIPFPERVAWFGGIGLGMYLLARVTEQVERGAKRLSIWIQPLTYVGMFLSAFAVIFSLPFAVSKTTATAASLAFAGALYLAIAYRGRYYRLGYLAMGMLQIAWVLILLVWDVQEPQWYAIPAGLYFTAMGHLERNRGRALFARLIEGFGLAVLLVTTFVQSLNGAEGFPYFVLLLAEGVLVLWWGAARRQKLPFFSGLGATALNVIAQVVVLVNVYDINRWIINLGVGLLLVTAAIFVERQREKIIERSKEWRDALDTWE